MKTRAMQGSRLGFGWVPDLPDNRDHLYAAPMAKLGPLPLKVDLRKHCPPAFPLSGARITLFLPNPAGG